jgi:hypothetical protein
MMGGAYFPMTVRATTYKPMEADGTLVREIAPITSHIQKISSTSRQLTRS